MAEEPQKSVIEIHEEFLRRVEDGSAKIRGLSIITVVVAGLLAASYLAQIVLPYAGGGATATVSLTDPLLVTFELFLTALSLAWLYVGVSDYRFTARLSRSIGEARARERGVESEMTGGTAETDPPTG